MMQEIDGDGCAFLREADGDRPPDSLRGSGHERVLRGEAGRNARHTIRLAAWAASQMKVSSNGSRPSIKAARHAAFQRCLQGAALESARGYCERSEVHPLYSATLSRVTSFEGRSSTVDAGFCPLRMPTPTCTARRAMKNGSCEAEA